MKMTILIAILGLCVVSAAAEPLTPQNSFLFRDSRGYWLRLPNGLQPVKTTDYPDGRTMWTNFPLPKGTNLEEKSLIIVSGKYEDSAYAKPITPPTFTADGVTFTRSEFVDQAMSTSTDDIIYTWQKGKKKVFFIFHLKSRVLGKADDDGGQKPYNVAEQIKETETVMSTFRRL